MTLPTFRSSGRVACARGFLVLLAATFLAAPATARAQIPRKFKNLKVLPKDISRRELMETMRGFAGGLGVHCSACHVGEEGKPLSTYDFASDKKAMKRDARVMLRMVRAINGAYLSKLPQRDTPNVAVTCRTCHRGVRRPEPIDQIVEETIRHEGVDSALARYRELRKDYYGAAAYDFTDGPLLDLSERLVRNNQADDALRLLQLAIEFNPRSARSYFVVGQIHERQGDKQGAIDAYRKTLELVPGFRPARERLDSLGGGE
jgi:tetratricopeptide (TPR) repeat protein